MTQEGKTFSNQSFFQQEKYTYLHNIHDFTNIHLHLTEMNVYQALAVKAEPVVTSIYGKSVCLINDHLVLALYLGKLVTVAISEFFLQLPVGHVFSVKRTTENVNFSKCSTSVLKKHITKWLQ